MVQMAPHGNARALGVWFKRREAAFACRTLRGPDAIFLGSPWNLVGTGAGPKIFSNKSIFVNVGGTNEPPNSWV